MSERSTEMTVRKGLLSIKDMGGRRRLADRRKFPSMSYIPERRRENRRSGFDRRGILNCTLSPKIERRTAFMKLSEAVRVAENGRGRRS